MCRNRHLEIAAWALGVGLLGLATAAPLAAPRPTGAPEPTADPATGAAIRRGRWAPPARPAPPAASDLADPETAASPPDPDGAPAAGDALILALTAAAEEASWETLRSRVEERISARLAAIRARLPQGARRALADLRAGAVTLEVQVAALQVLSATLAVLLTVRLLRGRGDVAVCIEYPPELRGTFDVRLSTRRAPLRRVGRIASPAAAHRGRRRLGVSSRTARALVSRETQFRDVPARRIFVTVDGFVQPQGSEEVLRTHFQEQEVRVVRGRTVRVEFDFHPTECPVDVKILWDRRPVAHALVALSGVPGSTRYARGGPVRICVARGRHTLVVGSGDRVVEQPIEVDSFRPTCAVIELTERSNLLFTGCPPAVEPYLHGDVAAAARALEHDGQHRVSHRLLARFFRERGQPEAAARHFEEAGQPLEAAELYQSLSDFERAARLFERAGETAVAAEMYRATGNLAAAGEAFERAGELESSVDCFREAGDVARWIEVLEKKGAHYRAAQVAIERGDWSRAIRSLRRVPESDPHYLEASRQLADAYQREGQLDLAASTLEEVLRSQGEEKTPLDLCDRLARLLEDGGRFQRAAELLDLIRRRDATYPNLATRIEGLRKRCKAGKKDSSGADAIAAQVDAFTSESRYQILEVVGRGGMGIVFKARDRRLGRVVALKQLTENLRNHPKAIELFLREARSAAALNHPNIVTLHDAGREGDTFYITMELLEGQPLQRILRSRGRLGARDVARLGVQIAGGLAYAHGERIVHRDIKTANLFFTKSRVVKIMDFGLAKMVEEVRRATTTIGGTPYYMAPEQSLGKRVDHRADLYALGVTFFDLLTGTVPFAEGDVAYHHRHTPPPDPRDCADDLPDALAELVLELLAKKPEDRPESAAVVGARLQAIVRSMG